MLRCLSELLNHYIICLVHDCAAGQAVSCSGGNICVGLLAMATRGGPGMSQASLGRPGVDQLYNCTIQALHPSTTHGCQPIRLALHHLPFAERTQLHTHTHRGPWSSMRVGSGHGWVQAALPVVPEDFKAEGQGSRKIWMNYLHWRQVGGRKVDPGDCCCT